MTLIPYNILAHPSFSTPITILYKSLLDTIKQVSTLTDSQLSGYVSSLLPGRSTEELHLIILLFSPRESPEGQALPLSQLFLLENPAGLYALNVDFRNYLVNLKHNFKYRNQNEHEYSQNNCLKSQVRAQWYLKILHDFRHILFSQVINYEFILALLILFPKSPHSFLRRL